MSDNVTRKDFLKKLAGSSVAVAAGASLITACGESKPAKDPCTDTSGLSESDKTMRQNLGYVEKTPDVSKNCKNCQLYKMPEGGSKCGGCTLFGGPVTDNGYCNSWVAKINQG